MLKVLITGCKGGIGLDAAIRLAKLGHKVYATVRKEDSVKEVKEILDPVSKTAVVEKLDITVAKDREKILDWDLDVLVNNAGIGDSGPLIEIDIGRIRKVFDVNVFAALELTQMAAKKMIAKGNGKIIIMGSMYGLIPTPYMAPYGMTKFALEDMAYSLRIELKPFGIYVVMVNPGAYNTGFNKKNIEKKYQWMSSNSLYKDKMDIIKKEENNLYKLEVKKIDGISGQLVKAVTAEKPKNRYVAPKWQWLPIPIVRLFS